MVKDNRIVVSGNYGDIVFSGHIAIKRLKEYHSYVRELVTYKMITCNYFPQLISYRDNRLSIDKLTGDLSQLRELDLDVKLKMCKNLIPNISDAINYLHGIGISHCDISDKNILWDVNNNEYTFKLADFSLSRRVGTYQCSLYSLPYRPLENFLDDKSVDTYSGDIWALGMVITLFLHNGIFFRNGQDLFKFVYNHSPFQNKRSFMENFRESDYSLRVDSILSEINDIDILTHLQNMLYFNPEKRALPYSGTAETVGIVKTVKTVVNVETVVNVDNFPEVKEENYPLLYHMYNKLVENNVNREISCIISVYITIMFSCNFVIPLKSVIHRVCSLDNSWFEYSEIKDILNNNIDIVADSLVF